MTDEDRYNINAATCRSVGYYLEAQRKEAKKLRLAGFNKHAAEKEKIIAETQAELDALYDQQMELYRVKTEKDIELDRVDKIVHYVFTAEDVDFERSEYNRSTKEVGASMSIVAYLVEGVKLKGEDIARRLDISQSGLIYRRQQCINAMERSYSLRDKINRYKKELKLV